MSHQTPVLDDDVGETFNLYGLRAGQTPKSLVQKGAIMDFDIKRLVNAIAKQTGLTRSEVERAMAITVAEMKAGGVTKASRTRMAGRPAARRRWLRLELTDECLVRAC